jgi:alkanesulfonate monooxygenase SsuD/methylene tetrahydromethanopterin reductase-like flavin-dependent oxidoreductase (luciferase family)
MFILRFDLRIPPVSVLTHAEQYRTALEMARWADQHGVAMVALSEHHATDDGFMHSPLTIAAAILGATEHLAVNVSAVLVPLYDPVRLAEEIATIDLLAPGRLSVVAGLGYRPAKFEMFGKRLEDRASDLEDAVRLMLSAWSGEEVTFRGRRVRISPPPVTQPHPALLIGGTVPAAARRAARLRLPYCPAFADPALIAEYMAEAARVGFDEPVVAVSGGPGMVIVSHDPDALWERIGDHLLQDALAYAAWLPDGHQSSWKTSATSVEELRASPTHAIVTPEQCAELHRANGAVILHPLIAGIDPAIGWESLQLVADEVMPALAT